MPFPFCHQKDGQDPQKVQVRFGDIDKDAGGSVNARRLGVPLLAGQQGKHQVIAAQQGCIIAQRRPHKKRHRQQHNGRKGRAVTLRFGQRQRAQQRVGQQVDDAPAIQAAQRAKAQQACQRHTNRARQEWNDQKADRLADGVRHRIPHIVRQVQGKAVRHALHCAVLAVLLQGIARGVIGFFRPGIGVSAHTGRGMRIYPCTGERFQQVGHIVRVGAGSIKIKVPGGDGIGAQVMVGFVRRLQRRVGKYKQQPAQKDAHGPFCRKSFCKPPHTIPGQQTYFQKGRTPQRDHQGGHTVIQPKEHPPVIGPQHVAHGGAQHSQPPPHSGGQLL